MAYNEDKHERIEGKSPIGQEGDGFVKSLDRKLDKVEASLEESMGQFTDSVEKKVNKISNTLDEKIANLDEKKFEEKVENFFACVEKTTITFFTITIPRVVKKVYTFVRFTIPKLLESESWGIVAPFFILIVVLIIVAIIASR